jgi:hypothetical protein
MKKPFTKREIALSVATVISLALAAITSVYAANLHTKNKSESAVAQANAALLSEKDVESNKSANYTETICAEYRKLYQAYKTLATQNPPDIGIGYALPGSAKGEIDQCYQLE